MKIASADVRVVAEFPRSVREIENVFIPLADGTRLAARIWLPADAESDPVPAILEYIPYRKRDGTNPVDTLIHPYFAGHGYAAVRVDIRGTGESDGVLDDEYTQQEHDDCVEVLAWLARQTWCTGSCGMMGISWGGFNTLQVAALRPPALKAAITLCSSDDRYADNETFMGGCLLTAGLGWSASLFNYLACAPDPELVGERWREMWLKRLQHLTLPIANWLTHQRRDAFWKHGSVCENYERIVCPVYAIGGWADGFSNAVPRLLAGLRGPRKGLIGPWSHQHPHIAEPAPRIGFLQECVRWWDHWLKGIDTGIMREPIYRVWMQDWVPAKSGYAERPGRWIAEASWPSPRIVGRKLTLGPGTLTATPALESALSICSAADTGADAGQWCSFGSAGDLPGDQREDDKRSLCFDSPPLEECIEILGAPIVELEVIVDRPAAMLAVRLNDVAPHGESLRVSYGLLNLSHRDSHSALASSEPGRRYRVRVQLNDIAHAFPAGHRIRVAVSTAYWPLAWPAPEPVTLTIFTAASKLILPVRPPRREDASLSPFAPPEIPPELPITVHREAVARNDIVWGQRPGEVMQTTEGCDGYYAGAVTIEPIGMDCEKTKTEICRIHPERPNSARVDIVGHHRRGRGAWQTRTETSQAFSASSTEFIMEARIEAYEGAERIFVRNWSLRQRRDMM